MINNNQSIIDFLRSLKTGEPAVWFCKEEQAQPAMKNFTATISKNKLDFKIKQKKALLVVSGVIPQTVVIVEKLPNED